MWLGNAISNRRLQNRLNRWEIGTMNDGVRFNVLPRQPCSKKRPLVFTKTSHTLGCGLASLGEVMKLCDQSPQWVEKSLNLAAC